MLHRMDPNPTSAEERSSPRSSVLDDLAAPRAGAVDDGAASDAPAREDPEQPSELGPLPVLGMVAGMLVFTLGAIYALEFTIGAVVAALGAAAVIASVVAIARRRRLGTIGGLCLAGCLGWVLLVAGFVLGSRSYDERFIYGDPNPLWDDVGLVGALMAGLGLVLLLAAPAGIVLVAVVRLFRRAPSSA